MTISIVVPCYNEESTILTTVTAVMAYIKGFYSDHIFELLLVDDGSKDSTASILLSVATTYTGVIRPIFLPTNTGRGAAIRAGIRSSSGDYVIVLDADLSYNENHIGKILDKFFEDSRIDAVVISPYMRGGYVSGVPRDRLMLSRLANWMLAGFFDDKLSTVTCSVRGYRGNTIRALPLFENGKSLHLEILRKLSIRGSKIIEIPGSLVWKETKKRSRRGFGLNVFTSASQHLQLGLLNRPTRLFKYMAIILLLVAIYETINIVTVFIGFYTSLPSVPLDFGVWEALSLTFAKSPHSVVIAGLSWLLGWQIGLFLFLFKLLKLQHEELMRHILALWGRD